MEISTAAGHKTICVPVTSEADYRKLIHKVSTFRSFLDQCIADYPELFPAGIANGYWLHDAIHSKKLNVTTRRIKLVTSQAVDQVRPDFVLPYMVGKTDAVEKALYLRRFGVPFDAKRLCLWTGRQLLVSTLSILGSFLHRRDNG
jgi:hypothetical protein